MKKVIFNPNEPSSDYPPSPRRVTLSDRLIKYQIVQNQSQATLVLFGTVGVCIALIVYLNWPTHATESIDEKYYQDQILDE